MTQSQQHEMQDGHRGTRREYRDYGCMARSRRAQRCLRVLFYVYMSMYMVCRDTYTNYLYRVAMSNGSASGGVLATSTNAVPLRTTLMAKYK